MSEYRVRVPIAGTFEVTVDAENEKEAIEKAFEVEWTAEMKSDDDSFELYELEAYERLFEGNCTHVYDYMAYAEKQ